MALTKADIIEAVASSNGFTRKKSVETVETVLEIIKETLASGEDVLISGFGKFCVKEKHERKGRNPDYPADDRHITRARNIERLFKPGQRPPRNLARRLEQGCAKRRTERQCDDRRNRDGDGNRYGELNEKAAG